jgi:hypothetical protein
MSRYTPPCQWDLACVRDAGHDGDHLYPTPDTKPQPSVLRAPTTAAGRALLREILPGKPPFLSEIVPLRSIVAIEAEARAPLDVERLAHALHMLHVPGWFNGHRSSDLDLAADIAREYAALEEPTE